MPSPIRLSCGVYYHIFNRGNNGENLFREERNYGYFLKLYARHVEPVAETYAYCLLKNHFHFLVRIKDGDQAAAPSQAFSNLFNAYSKAVNKAWQRTGSLFEHPFGRIVVSGDAYFRQLVTYIHRNPQRHRLVSDFRDWKYSSYHGLIRPGATRLQRAAVVEWFSTPAKLAEAHAREGDEAVIAMLAPSDFD